MPAYSYLKTDIINTSENDSTEFEDQISYFVNRSEDRLIKELDDSGLDYYSSFTFTASDPVVSLVHLLILLHYYKDLTNML